jgi:hypothetical protein
MQCLLLILLSIAVTAASSDSVQRHDFALQEAGGSGSFALIEGRGEWVALHFLLKTTCPYCIRHTHEYSTRAGEASGVRHAMIGMSLGPVTGHLVSQIVGEQDPDSDLGLLDPDRFSRGAEIS